MKKVKPKKICAGKYLYRGYEIICHGYYPPEQRVVWEAINIKSDTGDFREFTLKSIIKSIDEELDSDEEAGINGRIIAKMRKIFG